MCPLRLRRARYEEDHVWPFGPLGPAWLRRLGHGRQGPAVNLGAARPRWSRWSSDLSRTLREPNVQRQRGPLLAGPPCLTRGARHGLGGQDRRPSLTTSDAANIGGPVQTSPLEVCAQLSLRHSDTEAAIGEPMSSA